MPAPAAASPNRISAFAQRVEPLEPDGGVQAVEFVGERFRHHFTST
jgi:hypothetical protein